MSEHIPISADVATITSKDIFRQVRKNELVLPCPEAFKHYMDAKEINETDPETNPEVSHAGSNVFGIALPGVMLELEEKRQRARDTGEPEPDDLEPAHLTYIKQLIKVCQIFESSNLVQARLEAEARGQKPKDIPQEPIKYLHIKIDEVTATEANLQVGIDTVVDFGGSAVKGFAFIEDAEINLKDAGGEDLIGEDGYPIADPEANDRLSRLIKALSKTNLITFRVHPAPYEYATDEEVEEYKREIEGAEVISEEQKPKVIVEPRFPRSHQPLRKPHFATNKPTHIHHNLHQRRHP